MTDLGRIHVHTGGEFGTCLCGNGRRYVGIDLSTDYLDLSLRSRLAQTAMLEVDDHA